MSLIRCSPDKAELLGRSIGSQEEGPRCDRPEGGARLRCMRCPGRGGAAELRPVVVVVVEEGVCVGWSAQDARQTGQLHRVS